MDINILCIGKKEPFSDEWSGDFAKKSLQFEAKIQIHCLMNHKIKQAHSLANNPQHYAMAQKTYESVFDHYLVKSGYNIALDKQGTECDTEGFTKILENKSTISFFIGGAFGFSRNFLEKCDHILSLSKLTFSHKVAQILLCEQIFRALSLKNHHPYHK